MLTCEPPHRIDVRVTGILAIDRMRSDGDDVVAVRGCAYSDNASLVACCCDNDRTGANRRVDRALQSLAARNTHFAPGADQYDLRRIGASRRYAVGRLVTGTPAAHLIASATSDIAPPHLPSARTGTTLMFQPMPAIPAAIIRSGSYHAGAMSAVPRAGRVANILLVGCVVIAKRMPSQRPIT